MYTKIFNQIFKIIPILFLLTLFGCTGKQGCTDPYAENYDASADKENNTCISPREKFKGIYGITYMCSAGAKPEEKLIEIKAAPDNLTDILIYGLNGFSEPTRATVSKSEILIKHNLDRKINIFYGPWKYIEGKGNIVGGNITIQYQIGSPTPNPDIIEYSCVATLTK